MQPWPEHCSTSVCLPSTRGQLLHHLSSKNGPNFRDGHKKWIVEAPSSNSGVLPLANFSSVTFTSAAATINGVTGPVDELELAIHCDQHGLLLWRFATGYDVLP